MTHVSPPAMMQRALPPASAAPTFTALLGDRRRLNAALLEKRATIARLEAEWVAAAEADAAAGHARTVRMDDRETWDRATWDSYLAAAFKHEPDYMPPIKRLLIEIENIDQLLTLLCSTKAEAVTARHSPMSGPTPLVAFVEPPSTTDIFVECRNGRRKRLAWRRRVAPGQPGFGGVR